MAFLTCRAPIASRPSSANVQVGGSGTVVGGVVDAPATNRYPEPPPSDKVGIRVSACAPAPSAKLAQLMPLVARQTTGSSPQSMPDVGIDVRPRLTPKSNSSNRSMERNASTTVSVAPLAPAKKVQAGASRNVVGVPELP